MFYHPPTPKKRDLTWVFPAVFAIVIVVAGLMVALTPRPGVSDRDKTIYWADSIEGVWGGESWYPSIREVSVRGSVGTVVTTIVPSAAQELCHSVAVSVYNRDADPIGIEQIFVVDEAGKMLASCGTQ